MKCLLPFSWVSHSIAAVILVGSPDKTDLLRCFAPHEPKGAMGLDFRTWRIEVDSNIINVQISDTGRCVHPCTSVSFSNSPFAPSLPSHRCTTPLLSTPSTTSILDVYLFPICHDMGYHTCTIHCWYVFNDFVCVCVCMCVCVCVCVCVCEHGCTRWRCVPVACQERFRSITRKWVG